MDRMFRGKRPVEPHVDQLVLKPSYLRHFLDCCRTGLCEARQCSAYFKRRLVKRLLLLGLLIKRQRQGNEGMRSSRSARTKSEC